MCCGVQGDTVFANWATPRELQNTDYRIVTKLRCSGEVCRQSRGEATPSHKLAVGTRPNAFVVVVAALRCEFARRRSVLELLLLGRRRAAEVRKYAGLAECVRVLEQVNLRLAHRDSDVSSARAIEEGAESGDALLLPIRHAQVGHPGLLLRSHLCAPARKGGLSSLPRPALSVYVNSHPQTCIFPLGCHFASSTRFF